MGLLFFMIEQQACMMADIALLQSTSDWLTADIASLQMNAAVVETNVQWMRWHWEDGFDSEEATNSD